MEGAQKYAGDFPARDWTNSVPRIPAFVFESSVTPEGARLVTADRPFTRAYATVHSHHALVFI